MRGWATLGGGCSSHNRWSHGGSSRTQAADCIPSPAHPGQQRTTPESRGQRDCPGFLAHHSQEGGQSAGGQPPVPPAKVFTEGLTESAWTPACSDME